MKFISGLEHRNLYRGMHKPLVNLNMQRVLIVSFCVILFQIVVLFDDSYIQNKFFYLGCAVLLSVSLVYIFFIKFVFENIKLSDGPIRMIYLSYWVAICLGFFPYFYMDAIDGVRPMWGIIFASILVIAPVFRVWETSIVIAVFFSTNMLAAYLNEAVWYYYLYIGIVSIASVLFSYYSHGQYIALLSKFEEETNTDPLTKLFNRRAGFEKAKVMVEICKRHQEVCAVLIADIDHFKDFNDTYGHYAGDDALIKVADTIKKCFLRNSDICFRYGGEEFVVCYSVAQKDDALMLAEKLRAAVENLKIKSGSNTEGEFLTISVGVALYIPGDDMSISDFELIRAADDELYLAKNASRNAVFYNGERHTGEAFTK